MPPDLGALRASSMAMTMLGSPFLFGSFLVYAAFLCLLCLFLVRRLVAVGTLPTSVFTSCLVGVFAWVLFWGLVGRSEVLADWDAVPPRLVFAIPLLFGATLAFAFSRIGTALARHSTFTTLIGLQAFRLPLELLLYRAHLEGIMPPQMSVAGYNYDVTTGILAVLVLLWLPEGDVPRWVAWVFNVFGSLLLGIILAIAVLSVPTFAAFGPDRTNTWVAHFPYVYLPAVMVQLALLGHVLSFRKLLSTAAPDPLKDTRDTEPNRFRASRT